MKPATVYSRLPEETAYHMVKGLNDHSKDEFEAKFIQYCGEYRNKNISDPSILYLKIYSNNILLDVSYIISVVMESLVYSSAIVDKAVIYEVVVSKELDFDNQGVSFKIEPKKENHDFFESMS